jgi:hypothetical protein
LVAIKLADDLAVLDFVGVRDTPVDRYIGALGSGAPVRVADDPWMSIDVLVDLDLPIVEGLHPLSQRSHDRITSPQHLGYARSGLKIA